MGDLLPFGAGAWLVIGVYLSSLLVIGWLGLRARRENTLQDFYLGGQGFGLVVLVLTLYATQYSGNTLFGFTGKTYRIGYAWIMSLHFMTAIVVCYLLFAPRLYVRAKARGYITPTDFLQDRYRSRALNLIATLVMIVALSNYLLAQLMAMGRALQGLASAHADQAYAYGVVTLALIMVIYGTLGGLRAVAWTDVIQGLVLLLGFGTLLLLLLEHFGSLASATERILASADATVVGKALPPDANRNREWLSYIVLVGLGGALYPQAIQRIYAARSARVLRLSLAIMAFLPLTAVLIAVIAGVMAIAYLPGLEDAASDQVLTRILAIVQQQSTFGYWLVVLLFAALLAAMMSTADSALLSISSMLTKDLYNRLIDPSATEATLARLGKAFSWLLISVLVGLAIALQEKTSLVALLDRKFDLLVQLAPAFILGIRWSGLRSGPTLIGLVAGIGVSLLLAFGPFDFVRGGKIAGIHPGLIGLLCNSILAVGGSIRINRIKPALNNL